MFDWVETDFALPMTVTIPGYGRIHRHSVSLITYQKVPPPPPLHVDDHLLFHLPLYVYALYYMRGPVDAMISQVCMGLEHT